MLNLDPGKLLVIGVVAIILLGPDRLPQVARQVGGAWRSFNDFRHRMETEVRSNIPDLPSSTDIARLARSPSALLNHLSNMDGGGDGADGAGAGATNSANGNARVEADSLPDGAPIQPFVSGPRPSSGSPAPAPSSSPSPHVIADGDPSLN